MKNLAPGIFRQRLLVEGYYQASLDKKVVAQLLLGLAGHLDLGVYGQPVVFSPVSGEGSLENQGFDAFVPLVDSGISGYFWSQARFFSVVVYSCKSFIPQAACDFLRRELAVKGEMAHLSF